jgi:hypothetical protein
MRAPHGPERLRGVLSFGLELVRTGGVPTGPWARLAVSRGAEHRTPSRSAPLVDYRLFRRFRFFVLRLKRTFSSVTRTSMTRVP